jgi:hypothetical protein
MSLIDDWTYEIIRACGLSTSNSDVNIIGLHRCINEIMSIKNLTDEEIVFCMGNLPKFHDEISDKDLMDFARALLKKAREG